MGLNTKPQSVLSALDNFFVSDAEATLEQLHRVSKLLNSSPESMEKIQQKFNFYFSYTSYAKIRKVLALVEYLSVFSSTKLAQIINTEKFMENFSAVIMEPEFQDIMLNFLRLWYDTYSSNRQQANRIFELIENLKPFGITMPAFYKSRYEGVDAEAILNISENKNKEIKEEHIEEDVSPIKRNINIPDEEDYEAFIVRAEAIRDKACGILMDSDLGVVPKYDINKEIPGLLDEITSALFSPYLQNNLVSEMPEKARSVIDDLTKYREKIHTKIDAGMFQSTNDSEWKAYGPEKQEDQVQQKLLSASDGYTGDLMLKYDMWGIFHELSLERFPYMMNPDEFVVYKTNPCEEGDKCRFAPTDRKGFVLGSAKKELHCPYYHNEQDMRRVFSYGSKNIDYTYTLCKEMGDCESGSCNNAHNFYEQSYHPFNYKKKKCSHTNKCKNGKYCPYFHSKEEKEGWNQLLKDCYNYKEEDEITEIDNDGDDSYHKRVSYPESVARHLPPNVIIPLDDGHGSNHNSHKGSPPDKKGRDIEMDAIETRSQVPLTKELDCTLVIRRKYMDPNSLTEVMSGNHCFNGVPLFATGTLNGYLEDGLNNGQINGQLPENGKTINS